MSDLTCLLRLFVMKMSLMLCGMNCRTMDLQIFPHSVPSEKVPNKGLCLKTVG
jgi:hypothetical protein